VSQSRKTIQPRNTYLARVELTRYNPATNAYVTWTGTNGFVSFCTDALGASVIPGLGNFALTEGVAGVYYAQIDPTSTNLLIPYAGQTIYQVVRMGPNALIPDLDGVVPLLVEQPRYL